MDYITVLWPKFLKRIWFYDKHICAITDKIKTDLQCHGILLGKCENNNFTMLFVGECIPKCYYNSAEYTFSFWRTALLKTQLGTLPKSCQYPCYRLSSIGVLVVISHFLYLPVSLYCSFSLSSRLSSLRKAAVFKGMQYPSSCSYGPGNCMGLRGSRHSGCCWLLLSWLLNQSLA